jgi:hypothetical protein
VLATSLQAQVPTWEPKIEMSLPTSVTAAYSDNYGQHILRQTVFDPITQSVGFNHFLFGNDGALIATNSGKIVRPGGGDPMLNTTFSASVTGYGGVLYVVGARREAASFEARFIDLYKSTNGGETWTYETPIDLVGIATVKDIDVTADENGIHLVWDNHIDTRVFYRRFFRGEWRPLAEVTLSGTTATRPKVVTVGTKAIVSLVNTTPGSNNIGTSRDYDVVSETFEPTYRVTNTMSEVAQSNIGASSNEVHMLLLPLFSGDRNLRFTKRTVTGQWEALATSSWFANGDEVLDYRRRVATANGALYVLYHSSAGSTGRFFVADYTTQWTTQPFEVGNWTLEQPSAYTEQQALCPPLGPACTSIGLKTLAAAL